MEDFWYYRAGGGISNLYSEDDAVHLAMTNHDLIVFKATLVQDEEL